MTFRSPPSVRAEPVEASAARLTALRQAQGERGLAWREEFRRGSGSVGVARARDIRNRARLSADTVRRMSSFFARHEVDKEAEGFRRGEDGFPSAGRIAWALWGGDPGMAWANDRLSQIKAIQES